VAGRSCSDCKAYLYDDRGEVMTRGGKPCPRPANAPTPCKTCPKIPPGAEPRPENAVELDEAGLDCWRFYKECKAVGEFPRDPLVRAAAGVFRAVEDAAERAGQSRTQAVTLGHILKQVLPHAAPG
jgi:hypothetical protein